VQKYDPGAVEAVELDALDALMEQHSPAKPYLYGWSVLLTGVRGNHYEPLRLYGTLTVLPKAESTASYMAEMPPPGAPLEEFAKTAFQVVEEKIQSATRRAQEDFAANGPPRSYGCRMELPVYYVRCLSDEAKRLQYRSSAQMLEALVFSQTGQRPMKFDAPMIRPPTVDDLKEKQVFVWHWRPGMDAAVETLLKGRAGRCSKDALSLWTMYSLDEWFGWSPRIWGRIPRPFEGQRGGVPY
jgi:hypothetical protein